MVKNWIMTRTNNQSKRRGNQRPKAMFNWRIPNQNPEI